MSADLLNVKQRIVIDDSINNVEYHSYQSYTPGPLNYNDECRIVIQQQELITAPNQSYLQIQGKFTKHGSVDLVTKCKLVNNFIAFLFEEVRYELGGVLIDRVKNPGITTSMKSYASFSPSKTHSLTHSSWDPTDSYADFNKATGTFDICWPLSSIFGFAEDYKKVLLNVRQELVLIRSGDDLSAMVEATGVEKGQITINKIVWKMPHYTLSDEAKYKLMNTIENNAPIEIAHRKWELFTYPTLPSTYTFSWVLKSSSQLEKPRFVIFGLQTDRKNNLKTDASKFDHGNLKNIRLFLNSQSYPYENLNLDYEKDSFSLAYELYTKFQQAYYGYDIFEPLLNKDRFKSIAPLIVIDCSHQNETIKQGTVDARLEFETTKDIPDKTHAYCLVLHEQFLSYEPLTGVVRIL